MPNDPVQALETALMRLESEVARVDLNPEERTVLRRLLQRLAETDPDQAIPLPVEAPTALRVSSLGDVLYLASSVNDGTTTRLFRFDINRSGNSAISLSGSGMLDVDNSGALANSSLISRSCDWIDLKTCSDRTLPSTTAALS